MHVHLIAPSNEDSTYIKPLWAATLAAHTPDDVELTFRDDGLEPDRSRARIRRAGPRRHQRELEDRGALVRASPTRTESAGSKVILGGIHVTALPEEGLAHADAVLAGEAEWLWQKVIEDAKAGKLGRQTSLMSRGVYKHAEWPSLENLPHAEAHISRSRLQLRAVRRRADHARLPVPVRVLQRVDLQRHDVSLSSREGSASPSSRRSGRACSSATTT